MTLMSKDVPTSSVVDSFENQSARYPDYENLFKGGTKIGVGINKPLHTDIICGRGKMTTSHPANRRFRQLIDTHKFSYQNSKRRDEKTKITCDLVDKLLSEGRFILFDPKTKLWHEVSEEYAREKVSHSLRSRSSSYERNSVTRHTTTAVNDNFGIEDEANGISEYQISTNTIAPTFITCTTNNAVADLPMDINALPSSSTTKATNTLSRDMINANDNDKIKTSVHRFNNKISKHPPPHHRNTSGKQKQQQHSSGPEHDETVRRLIQDQQELLRNMIQKESERCHSLSLPAPFLLSATSTAVKTNGIDTAAAASTSTAASTQATTIKAR